MSSIYFMIIIFYVRKTLIAFIHQNVKSVNIYRKLTDKHFNFDCLISLTYFRDPNLITKQPKLKLNLTQK